ncbi:hypothetical protein HNR07_003163 [Nocardiopsis metallicus]|uniref:Uncharacterized protein n=1 Tax=Nocardiopsis metallicus TaxID=179819 RepID=A0A840WK84_9ACTN|nr:hypothetical protein [Nocardiopsis metallicus]
MAAPGSGRGVFEVARVMVWAIVVGSGWGDARRSSARGG